MCHCTKFPYIAPLCMTLKHTAINCKFVNFSALKLSLNLLTCNKPNKKHPRTVYIFTIINGSVHVESFGVSVSVTTTVTVSEGRHLFKLLIEIMYSVWI